MKKKTLALILVWMIISINGFAQIGEISPIPVLKRAPEPFLFSRTTLTPLDLKWSMDYSTSYGERVTGPFGFNGIGQQVGVKGYLGKQFTLYAHAAFGFTNNDNVTSGQQVEIIHDFVGGVKNQGLRLGVGIGGSKDFSNIGAILCRVTVSYDAPRWKAGGNLLLEKSFSGNRDKIDIISSIGFHHILFGRLYGGFESVGEDLEGFWNSEEAEGGAKLLVGPSLNMTTNNSRISFSVSGGPVFYATRSQMTNPEAMRELPYQSGLSLRAKVTFNLSE